MRPTAEQRPQNATANHFTPPFVAFLVPGATNAHNTAWANRIDGNFQGTTDEIIQWASCKWGLDEDIERARAVNESYWIQSSHGDDTTDPARCALMGLSAPCSESYGLMQVRGTVFDNSYPRSLQSTAWNADFAAAYLRACFEGDDSWQNGLNPPRPYVAGDEIGCTGMWFSGRWYDTGANAYISALQGHLTDKPWLAPGF